jgi:hypothetical protein
MSLENKLAGFRVQGLGFQRLVDSEPFLKAQIEQRKLLPKAFF